MRCERTFVCCAVLLLQLAIPIGGHAQDDQTRVEDEKDIQFKISDTPTEKRLYRPDPKLLQQRVIASIRLYPLGRVNESLIRADELAAVRRCTEFGTRSILYPSRRHSHSGKSLSDFFRNLTEAIPEDVRPTDKDTEFFLAEAVNAGFVEFDAIPQPVGSLETVDFTILAPSQEVAESRARTLVSLLRFGITDPIRKHVESRKETLLVEMDSYKTKTETIQQAQLEVAKRLEGATDIEFAEMTQLRTQRRLLDVEVAGVRARIEAVEKLRQGEALDDSTRKKLDDIKMTSEIDLAGLAARKKALTELISLGEERFDLESQRDHLAADFNVARNKVASAEKSLDRYEQALTSVQSLLLPYENEVTIAPILWIK